MCLLRVITRFTNIHQNGQLRRYQSSIRVLDHNLHLRFWKRRVLHENRTDSTAYASPWRRRRWITWPIPTNDYWRNSSLCHNTCSIACRLLLLQATKEYSTQLRLRSWGSSHNSLEASHSWPNSKCAIALRNSTDRRNEHSSISSSRSGVTWFEHND